MDENKLEAKLKAKQAQMEKNKEEIVGLKKKLSDVRKKKLLRERQEQEAKLLRIVRKLRPALERVYGSSFFQKPEAEIEGILLKLLPKETGTLPTEEPRDLGTRPMPDTGTDPFQNPNYEVMEHATGWE